MFKKTICCILSVTVLAALPAGLSASAQSSHFEKFQNDEINNYDTATYSDFIVADNQKVKLYPTFENQQVALAAIKKAIPGFLNDLAEEYHLDDLSANNWEQYRNAVYNYGSDNEDANKLIDFFDIYENKEVNKDIKSLNNNIALSRKEKDQKLLTVLPYNSGFSPDTAVSADSADTGSLTLAASSTTLQALSASAATKHYPNLNNMKSYASKWYNSCNPNYPSYFYDDSANFASQILEAGGMHQAVYWSYVQGWWAYPNYSSFSWHEADYFVKYWKIAYSTKNHYNFSLHIFSGDFIASDPTGDGSFDHIGFVPVADNYASTYNGKYYYDYMVAQHTNSYYAWTSSSTNNWENLESNYNVYAVIQPSQTY